MLKHKGYAPPPFPNSPTISYFLPLLSARHNDICMEGGEKADKIISVFLKPRIDVYILELNYLYT